MAGPGPRRLLRRQDPGRAGRFGVERPRGQDDLDRAGRLPAWLGNEVLHRSHRAALLRKDPDWYGPRFPDAPDDAGYHWPVGMSAPD